MTGPCIGTLPSFDQGRWRNAALSFHNPLALDPIFFFLSLLAAAVFCCFLAICELLASSASALLIVCLPEGGACSSWIKHGFSHSLRQRLRGVTG
jgi:hypothetical protein